MQNKETDMGYIWKVLCEGSVSNINKRKNKKDLRTSHLYSKGG